MSPTRSTSSAGHDAILWAVGILIGLNLLIAWRYAKTHPTPSGVSAPHGTNTTNQASTASGGDHASSATADVDAKAPESKAAPQNAEGKTPETAKSTEPANSGAAPAEVGGSAVPGGDKVRGVVVLKGTPPQEKVITPISKDANCGKIYTSAPTTRNYVVGADGGLANTFVYIKSGLAGKKFDPPGTKVEIDQKGCLYSPYVVGVMAGQTVAIKNSDPFTHNVNFPSSKSGNPPFNFAQASAGLVNDKVFPKPEIFAKLVCNIHPWMACFVGIAESPYFGVTDKDGQFQFATGLPAGDYVVEAIHPKAGAVQVPVKIGPDGGATMKFALAVAQ